MVVALARNRWSRSPIVQYEALETATRGRQFSLVSWHLQCSFLCHCRQDRELGLQRDSSKIVCGLGDTLRISITQCGKTAVGIRMVSRISEHIVMVLVWIMPQTRSPHEYMVEFPRLAPVKRKQHHSDERRERFQNNK